MTTELHSITKCYCKLCCSQIIYNTLNIFIVNIIDYQLHIIIDSVNQYSSIGWSAEKEDIRLVKRGENTSPLSQHYAI